MLTFQAVSKSFGHNRVIDNFSQTFDSGKTCIVGENGCGKTTLLMLAAGLEQPCSGQISLNQVSVNELAAKPHIGLSSDKVIYPRFLTAKQLIEFHCQTYQAQWPQDLLDKLHFNAHIHTKAPELSLGNQKKLSLILALCHQPQCLLLDEPSTGLDSHSRQVIAQLLEQFDGCLVITSHDRSYSQNPNYHILELAAKA